MSTVIQAAHRFGNPTVPVLRAVDPPAKRDDDEFGVDKLVQGFIKSRRMQSTRDSYLGDIVGYLTYLSSLDRSFFTATREDVDDWRLSMEANNLSPATIGRRLAAINGLYTYGVVDWSGNPPVSSNPAKEVARPKVGNNIQYSGLSSEQIRTLLHAVEEGPYRLKDRNWVRTAAIVSVLAITGVRRNELVRADVESLATERGHHILHVVRKGGMRQGLVLAPRGHSALQRYLDGRTSGPLILSEEGKRIDGSGVYRAVDRLGKHVFPELSGNLHPHDLRHSCATLLYELGASDWEVQTVLGHADVRTTRRYNHARLTLDESPLYKLGAALA